MNFTPSTLAGIPAATGGDEPFGVDLPVATIPDGARDPFSPGNYAGAFAPANLPGDLLNFQPASDPDEPYITRMAGGGFTINRIPDPDELSPETYDLHKGNPALAIKAMINGPEALRADRERIILGKMQSVGELILPLPGMEENIESLAARAGMTVAEAEFWREKDKQYLDDQIAYRDVLRLSGPNGYVTQQLQNERGAKGLRWDNVVLAQMEADYLATNGSVIGRFGFDLRAGLGTVGIFAAKALAGGSRMMGDFYDFGDGIFQSVIPDKSVIGAKFQGARDWSKNWLEWQNNEWDDIVQWSEANWSKPNIDTGSPVMDWTRGAVGRGIPFMAGAVGLAAIPGVGTSGAAGIIAGGMGSGTVFDLRKDGVSPGLALAAGAMTFAGSYLSTKFQLDNLTRYLGGRSHMRLFSVGTATEVGSEMFQEFTENTTQVVAESAARLIGLPEYTAKNFWTDIKNGLSESLDEGLAVGPTVAAMRLVGFPLAARNAARARSFAKHFTKSAEAAGKTELFKSSPETLAGQLTAMAWHNGDGRVFTTVASLDQAGVTRSQATAPVAEGGMGVDAKAYDDARATGADFAVGYGQAMVFGQKQAEAGNTLVLESFMADPDSLSVGDIARQRAEAEAIITQAETYYQEEVKGDAPGTPLRIKIFKAGLRAAGFDVHQAAALTAIYRRGAERQAELSGETVEQWLTRKNVRLEFEQTLLNTGRQEAKHYIQLLRELDIGEDVMAEESATGESSPASGAPARVTREAGDAVAARINPTAEEAAQSSLTELMQPAENDADNQAWFDEATDNVMREMGLEGEEYAPLAAELRKVIESGVSDPDVRLVAERMGISLPASVQAWDLAREVDIIRSQGQVFKLEIPNDDELLHEELPVSKQPESVRSKLRGINGEKSIHLSDDMTGKQVYEEISQVTGSEQEASKLLNSLGIKGIAYTGRIDGPAAVIFDDNAISILETFYQGKPAGNWGSIAFPATEGDATDISLFEGANASTIIHELNHLFINDLVGLIKNGKGGEKARRHLDALNAFADNNLLSGDPAKRRDAYEKIARAWEWYFMNGRAPASALEEPFAVIRKYMAAAYRNVLNSPLVEPSAAVRNVFDRMLATDQQIEDAARIREIKEDWTKAGKTGERVKRRMDAINARRDDRKRKRQDAKSGAGRAMRNDSRLDAARRIVKDGLVKEPVYRAIDLAKAMGGLDWVQAAGLVGEKAVEDIKEKHGKSVFMDRAADVFAPEDHAASAALGDVAKQAGFDDLATMLSAMLDAEPIDARTEREARAKQDVDDLVEDIEREIEDETEGVDDDSEEYTEEKDPTAKTGEMSEREEADADEQDMGEEVELAIEDEIADGGDSASSRDLGEALREWRNAMAAMKQLAFQKISGMSMREAADIRAAQAARNTAKRKAVEAALAGDRAKVTAYKKAEMYHFFEIQAAKQARQLRQHIAKRYSSGGLRSLINAVAPETEKLRELIKNGYSGEQLRLAMNAAEHSPKIEYEYVRSMAEIALYAGTGSGRFLRELAGDRMTATELVLPGESGEVEGLVQNIADTLDDWLRAKQRPESFRDFRDFTVDQLREIDRVMRWLIDSGRGKLAALEDADTKNLADLLEQSIEPMRRRDDRDAKLDRDDRTRAGRAWNRVKQFVISITLPETWFMMMDGNPTIRGEAAGVNQRKLFETMLHANVARDMLYKDVIGKMTPHFNALNGIKKRLEKEYGGKLFAVGGVPVPEILRRGRNVTSWDADLLISIALQMGNDANLRRLLTDADFDIRFGTRITSEGGQDMSVPRYNFTNAQLDAIAALFTAEEWDAIQGIWDGVNSLYEQADATTFALTNRHVRKEEAVALEVVAAGGQAKKLRGGYFPLVNDPMLSDRAAQLKEGQSIEDHIRQGTLGNINGTTAQTVGALKARARNEEGVPMSTLPQILSTNVIVQHIDAMAHYITHARPLRDIDRLTRSKEWRDVYVAKFGQARYDAIRRWVKNQAAPERGDTSAGGRFLERMRSLATVNALGLRWKTGLKQRLGAFQAAAFMGDAAGSSFAGWSYLVQGIWEMGRGNIGMHSEKVGKVNRLSEYMAARDGAFDREMRAMQSRLSPLHSEILGRSPGEWQNLAFFWIQANDRAMAYAVWLGAYKQAMAGKAGFSVTFDQNGELDAASKAEVVRYADSAARTQASSFSADLTEVQRDRGFMRFMSMFMSGNVRQGSRLMQYIDAHKLGDKSKGDVAMLAVREFVFPALAWVFMAAAAKSAMAAALGLDDDDDDESLLVDAFWETADTMAAPFPLLREIPRVMHYGVLAGDVPAIKSTAKAASNLFGAPGKVAEGKYMLAVGQVMDAAGYAFGIPVMNPLTDFFGINVAEKIGLKKGR